MRVWQHELPRQIGSRTLQTLFPLYILGGYPQKIWIHDSTGKAQLHQELASRHVTVNAVAPGFIATPMTEVLNEKQKDGILARVPAGRLGSPEDVAAAVLYLASIEAGYVTGQTLHVNGGMAMI